VARRAGAGGVRAGAAGQVWCERRELGPGGSQERGGADRWLWVGERWWRRSMALEPDAG
jgi:hypothetical protein